MTYKTKVHYGNSYWWTTITFEIPTKEYLKETLLEYKAGRGLSMSDTEVLEALAVIEQCKIPQTIDPPHGSTEYCDVGFIKITDIEWRG